MNSNGNLGNENGWAHITKVDGHKIFRMCSNCWADIPEGIEVEDVNFCWKCGAKFTHETQEDSGNENVEG